MPTIKYKDKTYGASRMGYHNTDAVSDVADDDELPVFDKSANAYKKTLFSSLKSKFWTYVQSQLASVATSGDYDDLTNAPNKRLIPMMAMTDDTVNIEENTDLNTIDMIKVGNYVCERRTTAITLTNCPTDTAFVMTVSAPIASTIDDELTKEYCYRIRRITDIYGKQFIQNIETSGTAGVFTYSGWESDLLKSGGTMTGALKFANGSSTENPNMPFFLGIDAFADGGEVHWIGKGTVANTIGALKVNDPAKSIYASDGRITSANLSASNSTSLKHLLATSQMATGKPSQDGHIVHMDWDTTAGWGAQLFVPNNDGSGCDMQWRGQNGGTWGNWRSLVDGKNFATNLSSVGISKTKLDGFYAKTFAHNAHTKIVIESTIATGTGYGRQAFFLFSVAGGSLFAIMFFVGTSGGNPVVSYQNVVGSVCTAGVASTKNGHVVGTFTVGARYDESTIMSGYDFTVNADG